MKKSLLKDSLKEIKNTYKRFISIMLMAFLGVGFFAGIRATSPDMIDTIDNYYRDNKVYDVQVLSTLGLTEDDVTEISALENVEKVVGTFEMDGKVKLDNKEVITRIMCVEDVNRPVLVEGEMPKNESECVVEQNFLKFQNKKIGDMIQLEVEDFKNDDGDDVPYLKEKNLKIVGTVKSPLYIARDRGTSQLGAGKIDYYLYISKENIQANDVYTTLYLKVSGAEQYKTDSKKYEDKVEQVENEINAIKDKREKARHDDLVNSAKKKVDDAEKTLNIEKQNAQQKIDEAQQKINDGKKEVETSEAQIKENEKKADTEFANAYRQIQSAKTTITQSEKDLQIEEQKANNQFATLETKKQELQSKLQIVNVTLNGLEAQYQQIKNNPDIPEEQKQNLLKQIEGIRKNKQDIEVGIKQIETGIEQGKQKIESGKQQIQSAKRELKKQESQYTSKKKTTYQQIENGKAQLEKAKQEIKVGEEELARNKQEFDEKVAEAEKKLMDAKAKIEEIENPEWYILNRYSNSGYNSFIQDTKSVKNIATIFPIVFFLVAALISLTPMTRMVEEQRTQIGTLKALGYKKRHIASKYILYATLACVIGGILGMTVGFYLLPSIIWKMYEMMYDITDISLSFNFEMGALGLICISICIIGATIYTILKELVHTPAVLMRPKAPKIGKRVLLERIKPIWKRLKFSQKVTVRNVFRYKKRFLMTIIGIMGCTALIVVGFGLRDSIRSIMPDQFEKVFQYDLQISLKNGLEDEQIQKYKTDLKKKDEIDKSMETYMAANTVINKEKEEEVQIIVPKEEKELEGMIQSTDTKTKEKVTLQENKICLTDKAAELLGVKAGDSIILKDTKEKEIKVTISNVVENYVYHYVYMSKTTYENLYGKTYETNILFTKNADISSEQEEQLVTDIINQKEVSGVSRISTMMNMMDDTMKSLNYVVIILIVSAGLLAFVVLYNLSNVNISERIRELATIKVLGFYDKEVYAYVTRETVILTIIGIALGLIAGYFLNYFIIGTCEINMLRFRKVIEPVSYLYSILITVAFTLIVNFVTYFALKKINMIESLKSVE